MDIVFRKLIGQGRTSEVYEYSTDKIIKLFRNGIPANVIKNEYRISLELYKKGFPVAKTFDFIEYNDRYGIVYEKINGISMLKYISSKPWKINVEARRLAELHKSIQNDIKIEIPDQKDRLKGDIARTDLLHNEVKDKLYRYIDNLKSDNMLCHGDFHPDNILISKEKVVVIDWMTATKGNPLADIARTSVIFKYAYIPEDKSVIEKKVINIIRNKFYSEYIKQYLQISNNTIEEIEQWELPIAAARLTEWLPENEKQVLLNYVNSKIQEI
ncbi:aminoglycoside phosphotransferase family protein [Clostridium sp.]|uniref:aminoglycoside phosphotransferase family protein n=1 Tax=Clostridium sp. TaxID=1506 RepID=UPI0028412914|nr:aminoglycoside phosphotransferase family protein [Clostridium sp.]MDR3595548.1 aminoglycoside phosphotransferase family protein [Clostridium sp.]